MNLLIVYKRKKKFKILSFKILSFKLICFTYSSICEKVENILGILPLGSRNFLGQKPTTISKTSNMNLLIVYKRKKNLRILSFKILSFKLICFTYSSICKKVENILGILPLGSRNFLGQKPTTIPKTSNMNLLIVYKRKKNLRFCHSRFCRSSSYALLIHQFVKKQKICQEFSHRVPGIFWARNPQQYLKPPT